MTLSFGELALRLVLAAVLGAAIGIEREAASRGAGVRTVALVALGSALFTLAGAYGFADESPPRVTDPTRIAAQVATGVGFIGAGAILRNGNTVLGLTTAASVWLAAAIGVVVAAGGYLAAVLSTAITLIVLIGLRLLKPVARRFIPDHWSVRVSDNDNDKDNGAPVDEAPATTGSGAGRSGQGPPPERPPAGRVRTEERARADEPADASEETYVDSPGAGLLGVIDDNPEPNEPA